jgi:hypothetical protein
VLGVALAIGCGGGEHASEEVAKRDTPLGPSEARLRALDTDLYVCAELGGGAEVNANRVAAGPWETFTLVDLDGGSLDSGDAIQLKTSDGQHYLLAELGGGARADATSTNAGPWETWTLVGLESDSIGPGARVALRASTGHYLVAEGGGGGEVNANRAAIGPWETFVIELEEDSDQGGEPPVDWTKDQWRDYVFGLIADKGVGPTVTFQALATMRTDINAVGADWQNGWRGDYRPRIYLPVPNCPPATSADAPACSYDRAVDLGDWDGPWLWIPRF